MVMLNSRKNIRQGMLVVALLGDIVQILAGVFLSSES